jgi:UDP-N-acetylglucosamine--N-acetylmuramyl-(pentapeptide) pyrophosphoryl-undecaprenol N-acetylglucosamine transferase
MADLLIASTGGHLAQLVRLAARVPGLSDEPTWVTFDTPQSRSLLAGRVVRHLPYTGSRAYARTVRNTWTAERILRERRWERAISTGAAPALSFLPLARAHGAEAIYIESAARSDGPSLTGRLLARVPGIRMFTQYERWADRRWRYAGSVFDSFEPVAQPGDGAIRRVVVTLGTIGRFGFPRLLLRLVEILPPHAEVLWQVGSTDATGIPINAVESLPSAQLDAAMRAADVVVAHAGIGSALAALDAGRCPILVPRERAHGEHVDDHQALIATELDARGLALHRSPERLVREDLEHAAARGVRTSAAPPPLPLLTA